LELKKIYLKNEKGPCFSEILTSLKLFSLITLLNLISFVSLKSWKRNLRRKKPAIIRYIIPIIFQTDIMSFTKVEFVVKGTILFIIGVTRTVLVK
jgi:hypothetical protein